MRVLILFVLGILASPFKTKSRLEVENAVLWQQCIVLRRKVRIGRGWRTLTVGFSSSSTDGSCLIVNSVPLAQSRELGDAPAMRDMLKRIW